MPSIVIETSIAAPIERVFDLSRSIDLHMQSTKATGETAVGGVTSGLIGLYQSVTWKARHFGVWQTLTSKITEYHRPRHFRDSMVAGAFRDFDHDHDFKEDGNVTVMTDRFAFASPYGIVGALVDALVMKRYLAKFLTIRNRVIKDAAESANWKRYLS